MARKTERLYASAPLVATDRVETSMSFNLALVNLHALGAKENREVLFDTLEVEIVRHYVDTRELTSLHERRVPTITSITVSAEAVLK